MITDTYIGERYVKSIIGGCLYLIKGQHKPIIEKEKTRLSAKKTILGMRRRKIVRIDDIVEPRKSSISLYPSMTNDQKGK